MKINSISPINISKQNNKNVKPAFKADVRIDPRCIDDEDFYPARGYMMPIIKKAKTAYKNVGSDNVMIKLEPTFYTDERTVFKKRKYGLKMTGCVKDIERARTEILENAEKRGINPNCDTLTDLRNKTPEMMERMKFEQIEVSDYFYASGIFGGEEKEKELSDKLEKSFDEAIRGLIYSLSNWPPEDRNYK